MSAKKSFSTETSERYSRALFEVANELNDLTKIESDAINFKTLMNSSIELNNFLQDPTKSIEIQKNVINLLSEKLVLSKIFNNFLLLLVEKRRIFFVKKIIDSFLSFCSKKRGEVKASLISSKELSQNELNEISNDLSKSIGLKIKFDYKVDKNLIGGLKLQLGSFMIDTSLKNKLKKLEQTMVEN